MLAEEDEIAPLLIPNKTTAGQYGSTHPAAAGGASEAEVPTTATTTTTPRASFAFGFDLHDDDDDDTAARTAGPGASGLLLEISTLLAEGDDAPSTGAAAAAAAVTCPAHRRLGPWAALLLAVAGAVVGGVGLWLGWSHATLLPVLVPCALLAFWPLLPALRRAARRRRTDTAALVAIGVGAALLLGHPGAALTMLAMALLAERVNTAADACVARSLGGSRGMRLPKVARRLLRVGGGDKEEEEEEEEELVPTSALLDGDVVVVRAGEIVPVDGEVVGAGQGAVEEAGLTGEAMPVEKREGSAVLAGSLLRAGTGALHIRYSTPSSLYHTMEEDATAAAAEGKGEGAGVVDRFSGWYTPLILAAAVILAVVPQAEYALRHGKPFALPATLRHMLELLVLASPMALAMAAPLPYLTTLAASVARGGVVVKTPLALERLGRVQVLALDKTGTLTQGRFRVSGRHQLASSILPVNLVRRLAAALEGGVAHHRLAAAVVEDGAVEGEEGEDVTVARLLELDGMGVEALCTVRPRADGGGKTKPTPYKVVVGSAFLLEDEERKEPGLRAFLENHPGEAHLFVVVDGRPELALALTDPIRPDAARAVAGLHALGIETAILTGDRPDAAAALQAQTGAQAARGRMGHEAKRQWVRARQVEPPPASLISGPRPLVAGDSPGARLLSALPAVITEEGDDTTTITTAGGSIVTTGAAPAAVGGGDEEEGGGSGSGSPAPRCRRTRVCMVGDGASDAPALAAADVGIAVSGGGPGGSALAVAAADVVVLLERGRGSLRRIPQAIDLAVAVRAVVLENVALAVAVKFIMLLIFLVGCAAWQRGLGNGGRSRLWMGVASDAVALAAVVANGLRPLLLARRGYK